MSASGVNGIIPKAKGFSSDVNPNCCPCETPVAAEVRS